MYTKSPHQKYHKGRCSEEAAKEKGRNRRRAFYKQYRWLILRENKYKNPSTGSLSAKPKTQFEEEYEKIIDEKRRLGLI